MTCGFSLETGGGFGEEKLHLGGFPAALSLDTGIWVVVKIRVPFWVP